MTDSPSVRIARCQCGALEARCSGAPWRVSLCHCFGCKARSGSDFSLNATYRDEQVETRGAALTYERRSDDGERSSLFSFCGTCGTTLWFRIEARPEAVTVPVGNFGTTDFPPPAYEVYAERTMAGLNLRIEPEAERQ